MSTITQEEEKISTSKKQKITPFLWFDNNAQEAVLFYTSIFKNSKIISTSNYDETGPKQNEKVVLVTFELEGQTFTAINGGPHFTFSPAISFFINCEDQEEVDDLWAKLSNGGEEQQCGWLKDKYGISWQIVPKALFTLLNDPDKVKAKNVMNAMLKMVKIDVKALEEAYHQV